MNKEKTYKILSAILIFQWAFYQFVAQYPSFIESYYSKGIYPIISNILHFTLGWIPFSFGDLLYFLLVVLLLLSLFKFIKNRKLDVIKTLYKSLAFLSVVYFIFNVGWGLNYYRNPINERLNFENTEYSKTELINFTKQLITKLNSVQKSITLNDSIVVENPMNRTIIQENAFKSYEVLGKINSDFTIKNKSVKKSLLSTPLTYAGFAGYLNPFTNEAQVNRLIPKNNYAATACHEIAHQIGIASENEANFVGFLAATHSDSKYFNYSGYLMALRYCLSDLYRNDKVAFEELKLTINKGILKDMQNSQNFWMSYQNRSEKYFKWFYDFFLKANKQKDGIRSYSKMVSLLINYYKTSAL
ncbi:Protein of unknown function [Lutibacter oricola]|uniref:Amino acid permease n=1 Tax=Lutibacter oricola TaxID=762486 RepID=A0A1H2X9R8_9FLAO|nr:DUF3810 domain-containing protein [Lutibacter oricola]SDW89506.1 Protein of unknown function [Lutibacter oricola]